MRRLTIDFLHRSDERLVGRALLAGGIVAFAASLWFEHVVAQEQNARDRLVETARGSAAAKLVISASPDAQRVARQRRLATVELRKPWIQSLRAVEDVTRAPVYLTALEIEAATGQLQLDAEAPSFDAALAYVQLLDVTGALMPAFLQSHADQTLARPDSPIVKFRVSTRWRPQ